MTEEVDYNTEMCATQQEKILDQKIKTLTELRGNAVMKHLSSLWALVHCFSVVLDSVTV